jgi:hypothetical protein
MKLIKKKYNKLFSNKSTGTIALVAGMLFTGVSSSFGITIGLASGSSPDCTGSVGVQGNINCSKSCESSSPVVTVVNSLCPGSSDQPSVSASCSGNVWTGTWGPASISLAKGVNVLTASDDCGSATLKVTSNGGSGPSISWSGTPVCTSTHGGFNSTWTVCCLSANTSYSASESVTASGSCGASGNINKQPYSFTTGADGCGSVPDANLARRDSGYCGCTIDIAQTITIKDSSGSLVGTFNTTGNIAFDACPNPNGNVSVTIGGDGGGDTMHCP